MVARMEIAIRRSRRENTAVFYGLQYVLKTFNRVEDGVNPDLEIGRYLVQQGVTDGIAPVVGAIEYRGRRSDRATLAVLHRYIPNQGTAWQLILDQLSQYFERVATLPRDQTPPLCRRSPRMRPPPPSRPRCLNVSC
jgi:maltose alpha-D-glucosyltransferase/alpha-amylase